MRSNMAQENCQLSRRQGTSLVHCHQSDAFGQGTGVHRQWLRTLGGHRVSPGALRRAVLPRLRAVRRKPGGQLAPGVGDQPAGLQPLRWAGHSLERPCTSSSADIIRGIPIFYVAFELQWLNLRQPKVQAGCVAIADSSEVIMHLTATFAVDIGSNRSGSASGLQGPGVRYSNHGRTEK